jgi:hypothetical protein
VSAADWNDSAQPGSDLHLWESQWASIEEDADGDPDAALSQYADLVERMLEANGYDVRDPVARSGDEREVIEAYVSARDTAERAELGDAARGEVTQAIEDLRAIYDSFASQAGLGPS